MESRKFKYSFKWPHKVAAATFFHLFFLNIYSFPIFPLSFLQLLNCCLKKRRKKNPLPLLCGSWADNPSPQLCHFQLTVKSVSKYWIVISNSIQESSHISTMETMRNMQNLAPIQAKLNTSAPWGGSVHFRGAKAREKIIKKTTSLKGDSLHQIEW